MAASVDALAAAIDGLEAVNVSPVEFLGRLPGIVYFAALPLKIEGGSGSPVRPVAFVPTR
jgi:kynurenine formamidase